MVFGLHDILLRLPPRRGRRGWNAILHRFAARASGGYKTLLRWWQQDRAAARHPRHASSHITEERAVQRAIQMLRGGHPSPGAPADQH
eukprot:10275025-Karenia_brevis.AAC.1